MSEKSVLQELKRMFGYSTCNGLYNTTWKQEDAVLTIEHLIFHTSVEDSQNKCVRKFTSTITLDIGLMEAEDVVVTKAINHHDCIDVYILCETRVYRYRIRATVNTACDVSTNPVTEVHTVLTGIAAIMENFQGDDITAETISGDIWVYPREKISKTPWLKTHYLNSDCCKITYMMNDTVHTSRCNRIVYTESNIPYIEDVLHGVRMVIPFKGLRNVLDTTQPPTETILSMYTDSQITAILWKYLNSKYVISWVVNSAQPVIMQVPDTAEYITLRDVDSIRGFYICDKTGVVLLPLLNAHSAKRYCSIKNH